MELAIPWSIMEQMALKDIVKNMRTAIRNKQNMLDSVHLFPAVLGRISENELAQSKTTGCIHEQVTMWCVKPNQNRFKLLHKVFYYLLLHTTLAKALAQVFMQHCWHQRCDTAFSVWFLSHKRSCYGSCYSYTATIYTYT